MKRRTEGNRLGCEKRRPLGSRGRWHAYAGGGNCGSKARTGVREMTAVTASRFERAIGRATVGRHRLRARAGRCISCNLKEGKKAANKQATRRMNNDHTRPS